MDRRRALQEIDATLKDAGFKETGPGFADYDGQIRVHGKPIDVHVSIPDVRFTQRPEIHLKDRKQVPVDVLAHVEVSTGICYASAAGLPLDMYQPGQAILRTLEEASRTLERSYAGKGARELIDEYQSYWRENLPVRCFRSKESVSKDVVLKSFFARQEGKVSFVGVADNLDLNGYVTDLPADATIWTSDQLLGLGGSVFIPKNLKDLKTWLLAQPGLKRRSWKSAIDVLLSNRYLMLAAPNAFLAVKLKVPGHIRHAAAKGAIRRVALPGMLEKMADRVLVNRYSGRWSSLQDIAGRNNPNMQSLSAIKVAVVGCGTIGSHLARFLVQSGAGQSHPLRLFDSEVLSEGNLGRHLLGFDGIGKSKASAVAEEVKRFHPQVIVQPVDDDVMGHLKSLQTVDLVIDATGDWNVQSSLNDWFMTLDAARPKALLHSWIFMNGAGVQSFLNLRDQYACFRCLKPRFEGPWRFPAGDPAEPLNLQPATCGDGAFVPFTVDVSVAAASLANRAALDFAAGAPGPRLRTVVTDYERGRYQKPRSPDPAPQCPACSSLRASS